MYIHSVYLKFINLREDLLPSQSARLKCAAKFQPIFIYECRNVQAHDNAIVFKAVILCPCLASKFLLIVLMVRFLSQ